MGDNGVGKSCILNQYINKRFENLSSTVGIDYWLKNVINNGVNYKLQLIDSSGQERYQKTLPNYMKKSYFLIIVFDMTCKNSFDNIESWINLFK